MSINKKLYKSLILMALLWAVILRLVYIAQLENKVWWVDEIDFLALGQAVADGNGFVKPDGQPTAFRAPGYPFFLAMLFKLGVDDILSIRLMHVVLCLLTIFFLARLSLKIGGRAVSVITTFIAASYPYFIYSAGTLYSVTWFSTTLMASVYFLFCGQQEDRLWKIGLAGFFMGLSILTQSSAAVLGAAELFWLLIIKRRSPKKAFCFTLVWGLVMSSFLLPWMMRNYRLFGKPVLSTNGGRNLWLGNNPESSVNSGSDIVMPPELAARISAATEIEADRIYSEEALKFAKANPKHYLWLAVQKGIALWRFDPSPTTEGYPRYKNLYSLISYISYAPILLFAVAGFFLTGRTDKKIELLWIFFGLAFTLLHAVYISKVRFRLPLDYFLIQMAATTLAAKIERSTAVKRFLQRLFAGFSHDQKTPLLSPRINSHRL